ncbi:MAG: hypothetical protein Q9184_005131 [Pyrenodesmia sp. 2 TL-2023]
MSKRGRGGASGNKLKMTLGLPVGAVMNCCDNSGARNLYIISVKGCGARLNRLPAAGVGDMVMATVKKGKPELRKKVMPAVVVRQSKPWRRADGVYLYFEDNAGVIVNPKGEMKGSAITGPVGKEAAELWPRIASNSGVVIFLFLLVPLSTLSTTYLYFYPTFHHCGFPLPPDSTRPAPFRLLALGDPQLEGDSSLPDPDEALFPSLGNLWQDLVASGSVSQGLLVIQRCLSRFFLSDTPRILKSNRKRLDLLGNDYYLAHIYQTLQRALEPTHVTVLGDLLGSQWISDEEFEHRGWRYWNRVFKYGLRVDDEVTAGIHVGTLSQQDVWKRRIINVAGNHDVGYAGDLTGERLQRFERVFGRANWETRFVLPSKGADHDISTLPALRIIVLNSLNLDTPAVDSELQTDTYKYINRIITASRPVEDQTSATILLTHVPLHKAEGVCVDGPWFDFYNDEEGGSLKEQNHLSYNAGKGILEGIYGMSGNPYAPHGGLGRNGIILSGHDHEGCDVYHHLPAGSEPESRRWSAEKWNASREDRDPATPGIREITVRSMMGEFGGNAGLLSAWFDEEQQRWRFEYSTCSLGVQHIWHTTPFSKKHRTIPKLPTQVQFHAQIQDQVLPTSMSSTITADQWDQRKEEILRLYIDEGWTLKPIKRKFESPDFHPTESQYRTKLKKWKRRKPRQRHQTQATTNGFLPSTTASPPSNWSCAEDESPTHESATYPVAEPIRVGELIPTMDVSSQSADQWHVSFNHTANGYETSAGPGAQHLIPDVGHADSQPQNNVYVDHSYEHAFPNSDEYLSLAKRRKAQSTYGSPGHSRVERDQRWRVPASFQQPKPFHPASGANPSYQYPYVSANMVGTAQPQLEANAFQAGPAIVEGQNWGWGVEAGHALDPMLATAETRKPPPIKLEIQKCLNSVTFLYPLLVLSNVPSLFVAEDWAPEPTRCGLTHSQGSALLRSPYHNKGSAFPPKERETFKLYGLLPPNVQTLEEQVARAYQQYSSCTGALAKNTFMTSLKDQNQLIQDHLKEMFSIIYTPTEGDAIQNFSRIFRQPEGCFLNIFDRDRIYNNLAQWGTADEVDYIVVTDGEENQQLLNDELYLGISRPRIRGQEYEEFVDNFVQSARKLYPKAYIHFEDFGLSNARRILDKYSQQLPCFNDDVQGTGCITLAAIMAGLHVSSLELKDMRMIVFGSGSAGTGIADQVRDAIATESGISEEEAAKQIWYAKTSVFTTELGQADHSCTLPGSHPGPTSLARDESEWHGKDHRDLLSIVKEIKPHVLIGTSTKPKTFTKQVVKEMAKHVDRPIIMPLSNPTRLHEADPKDIYEWTEGRALIATGSPFPPVTYKGKEYEVAECNNSCAFPGIGLGMILSRSRLLTKTLLVAAVKALAAQAPALKDPDKGLVPDVTNVREISVQVAKAVIRMAVQEGLATEGSIPDGDAELDEWVREQMWEPKYRPLVKVEREEATSLAKGEAGIGGTKREANFVFKTRAFSTSTVSSETSTMKSLIISAVIGTAALAIHGVAGVALPVNSVKRLEASGPGYQALAERSTLTPKRTCWEAINGQIQCSPEGSDDGSSTDTSTMTSDMDATTADDLTSDIASNTPTTCVHTADGFIQCGDVMGKREDLAHKRDVVPEPVPTPYVKDLMKRAHKIDGYTDRSGSCKNGHHWVQRKGHPEYCWQLDDTKSQADQIPQLWDWCYSNEPCSVPNFGVGPVTKREAGEGVEKLMAREVVGCHSKVKDFYWHNRQPCDAQTGKMSKYSVQPYGWQVNQTLVDLCFDSVGCPSGRNIAFGGCTAETNTYYYQNYTVDPSVPNAERCLVELYKGSKNVPDDQRKYNRDLIDTCFTNPNCPKRDVGPEYFEDWPEKRGVVAGNPNGLPTNAACVLDGTCKRDAMAEPVADPKRKKDKTKSKEYNMQNVDPINFSGTGEFITAKDLPREVLTKRIVGWKRDASPEGFGEMQAAW